MTLEHPKSFRCNNNADCADTMSFIYSEQSKEASSGVRYQNQCHFTLSLYLSEEQLKAFLEKVKGVASLQEMPGATANSDAVVAIVKKAWFSFSADNL